MKQTILAISILACTSAFAVDLAPEKYSPKITTQGYPGGYPGIWAQIAAALRPGR